MAETTSGAAKYRPLLLTLAVVFAVATIVYSAAWMYYVRRSELPVEVGIDTQPSPPGMIVTHVWNGSPAEKAGLEPKDVITAIDGRSVVAPQSCSQTLFQVWYDARPGEPVRLQIQRPGQAQPLVIAPIFRAAQGMGDTQSLVRRGAAEIIGFYPLLFLVVGLAVLFLRLEDSNAWLLALMFAGFITEADLPLGYALAPHWLLHFLYAYAGIMRGLLPAFFYFFFAVFPVRSPIDRKLPWLKWVLLAANASLQWGGVRNGEFDALPFINSLATARHIALVRILVAYGTVLLGVASLVWNAIGAPAVEDRRKLKVMLWGTVVGVAPAVLLGLGYDLTRMDTPFWAGFVKGTVLFLLPLSFAYAVAKHRVMDIPVLLRRSARYLLVERGFAILILLISVGITLWFGQAFSRRFSAGSRAAIPIGATFGVLLISGAIQVHRQVRTRLDRAFFRSAYDAQQILENLAANTLTVSDRPALAALLHEQIREALHPVPLLVYLLSAEGELQAYAGNPPEQEARLSAHARGLSELEGRRGAFEPDPDDLRGTALGRLHAECLVPIGGSSSPSADGSPESSNGRLSGLIVLGPRLSEEPYSTRDKRLLASVASQAGIAMRSISLAEKMAARIDAERRAEQEMQIARQVQSRLLPQEAPKLATLDCAGKCIQTRAVGGDYYDFLDFGSGKLGIVLADISGKGISGALLMANLQASLRGQYALALEDLPGLLRSVNSLFYKNTESNNYATMFFSLYDEASRTLRYVNCGHNPPMLLRSSGTVEQLEATATVLGLFAEWECSVSERQLAAGDVLLIYTDGISEAAPAEDAEEFGEDRLIAIMQALRHKCACEILDGIITDVQRFSQGEQADDMTLIVARGR
ncbi:MAG TPA: SpoIIE family protein phosphatase [Bryocella sp.]|nr:SpoIIE family protein phosphatase [Bryocella sp.]